MTEGREIQRVLAPAYDEERTAATWQRIAEARAGRRRSRRAPAWALGLGLAATAAAVTIALVLGGGGTDPGRPLASVDPAIPLGDGARVDAEDRVRAVVLDDGSQVELAVDTRLQVLANAGDRFVTLLERGAARFDIVPHGPRRWEIETSLATVEVVGTAFRVAHDERHLVVEVERGVVMVRGERVPGRVVRLVAGERIEIKAEVKTALITPAPAPAPAPSPTRSPSPSPSPSLTRSPSPSPSPSTVTGTTPPRIDPPAQTPPVAAGAATGVDAALAAADKLRASGDVSGAADLLDQALAADGRSPAAGLAAFTLGRLALDRLDQPERAARAFARVIALGSPTALLEDAYARRAEALIRAGDRGAAEAALTDYERAYPAARRAPALRAQLQGK